MHYTGGLASIGSFAAAAPLPHDGALWLAARFMLEATGGLFACYVIAIGLLTLTGMVLRVSDRRIAEKNGMAGDA